MASFEECVSFPLRNCPLFTEKNVILKAKQLETLRALYDNQDCISILPTGYGKSMIFQLLPWFSQCKYAKDKPMTAIVVSPLNSLMEDQVRSLRKNGIRACCLNITGTHGFTFNEGNIDTDPELEGDDEELQPTVVQCDVPFDELKNGEFTLVYSHPQALINTKFSRVLRSQSYQEHVCAIVIDEVHMVSEWGDEFRPAFKRLGEVVCVFDSTFHLLLTATVTPKSVQDLTKQMCLHSPIIVSENVDRPNIFLDVRNRIPNIHKFEKYDDLIEPIASERKTKKHLFPVTIMYVESLEAMGYFFQYTSYALQGDSYDGDDIPENRIFAQYHKDYPDSMKQVILTELTKENPKIRLVLATVALGMGVNAPSVDRIIHCRPPTTLEKYLQEIGRAGRLGQKSTAVMYFNKNDIAKNRKGMSEDMVLYCNHKGCLREMLVNHFGFDRCVFSGPKEDCCSNCKSLVLLHD
ncbi:ATP-dependent DNA helicase RecQ-like [Argopecten irradians]|uniref:ATP-dependent DNA helicase RecQ-like n=1 Tax=Argopecten irradians TaxID=31199 RepID=UPI00371E5C74